MGKHHGAWGDSDFSGRKGCDIFLEGDAEALGKKLSFLSSGSVSQKHPAREPWAHSPCPPGTWPPRSPPRTQALWGSACSAVPEAASSRAGERACEQR